MPEYKAPLREISFVMNELLDCEGLYQTLPGYEEANRELLDTIVEEAARFVEGELAPLYQSGDDEGCQLEDGVVTTPSGLSLIHI